MPIFRYKAVTRAGEVESGEMQGLNAATVVKHLQDNNKIPIFAEEILAGQRAWRVQRLWRRDDRLGAGALLAFTRSLSVLLSAGMPLDRSLTIMRNVEDEPASIRFIDSIQQQLRSGAALSCAVAESGQPVSQFYTSMLRAAEAGGNLATGLERLAEYLEYRREIRGRILSALAYPTILLVVAGLSILLLMSYVVPRFRPMFDDMGAALPMSTHVVLAVSDIVVHYGWIAVLLIPVVVIVVRRYLSVPRHRLACDALILRMPFLGPLVNAVETARLTRTFGTLLQNGVPLMDGLSIARDSLSNRAYAQALDHAAEELREGGQLAASLAATGRIPKLAIQMITVGEETGSLHDMMLRISAIYDARVNTASERVLTLLEPILIVGMGIGIAAIIMSILAGILSVNDLPI